jgi:membrane-bound lytic murein transglycosylase B
MAVTSPCAAEGAKKRSKKVAIKSPTSDSSALSSSVSFRGWDYLVLRLRENGVTEQDLIALYADPRMPIFTDVPFSVYPKEPSSIYATFNKPRFEEMGAEFIQRNQDSFRAVERILKVPPEVITAILVIESQIGKNTGREMIAYRLSRLASANAPENLVNNYKLQKRKYPKVTFDQVKRRGRYLEQTFLPEIPALLTIAKKNQVNPLSITGSSAGAFGLPQFLPSAFMRYSMDGDKDGIVSLHNEQDALWSTANYLASFGFRANIPVQEKRSIIWRYNKSKAYIDAVLKLSRGIKSRLSSS